MRQPRPCPTSVAVVLSVFYELSYILKDPFLKLSLELSYLLSLPEIIRKFVPMCCSPVAEAVLGQGQGGVGDSDLPCSVIS